MDAKQRKSILYVILAILLFSFISTVRFLPGQFNSFIDWIAIGILIPIIGHIANILYPRYTPALKKATIALTLFSLYMALGTGILHYQGEGGYRADLLKSKIGNEIKYSIEMHNGLKIPVDVDYTFLFGESGMEKTMVSSNKVSVKETKDDYRVINSAFTITEEKAELPRKAVVIYRIFRVLPMVNIMELRWPEMKI